MKSKDTEVHFCVGDRVIIKDGHTSLNSISNAILGRRKMSVIEPKSTGVVLEVKTHLNICFYIVLVAHPSREEPSTEVFLQGSLVPWEEPLEHE